MALLHLTAVRVEETAWPRDDDRPNQTLEPTAGRRTEKLKDDL